MLDSKLISDAENVSEVVALASYECQSASCQSAISFSVCECVCVCAHTHTYVCMLQRMCSNVPHKARGCSKRRLAKGKGRTGQGRAG